MEIVKKKILFLVTQSEMGGAQRYIYEIVRGLDPEKYEFLVVAGEGDNELFRKISKSKIQNPKLKVKIQNLKHLKRAPNPISIIRMIINITSILKKEKPNVLFLCSTTAGLLGSIASKIYKLQTKNFKLKTVYRIGGWAFRDPRPFFLNRIILLAEKITALFKDKIVVNSEIDRKLALKYKIVPSEKIIKIYNGLNPDSLEFLPKEKAQKILFEGPRSELAVGCVANFYKTKGLKYLIEAVSLLNSKLPTPPKRLGKPDQILDSRFIIIGDGKQRPRLEAKIKKLGLEGKVILAGRMSEAYKYLKAFDILVLPSLKEGFPWIILEAMAAKLPVVATNVGALPEIIENGKEGFLVPPKNSQALAEKIKWLLENPHQAKAMGKEAKAKLIKEFSLQKMVKETERIL